MTRYTYPKRSTRRWHPMLTWGRCGDGGLHHRPCGCPERRNWARVERILDERAQGFGTAIAEGRTTMRAHPRSSTARLTALLQAFVQGRDSKRTAGRAS
jgi:hypothetical protein